MSKTYDEVYEEQMSKRLAEGKVVRMYKPSCGWQYVSNKERAINGALRRDYVTEEDALAAGVPLGWTGSHKGHDVSGAKSSAPKLPQAKSVVDAGTAAPKDEAKPKRGPGRPRKVQTEDGE